MSEKNKGIFYGVVAIATLIVAIVGATLAYFSVFASSPNNAVGLSAKVVSISYLDGQNVALADELIPAEYKYVKESYENPNPGTREMCRDEHNVTDANGVKGYQICNVYGFTIENGGDAVDLFMNLKIGYNEYFENLRYMLYTVNEDSQTHAITKTNVYNSLISDNDANGKSYPITLGDTEVSISGYYLDNSEYKPQVYHMNAQSQQRFELVIYLNEASHDGEDIEQNFEQGKNFAGTIEIKLANYDDKITGFVTTD